jgi:hypothetical protein
MKNLIFKSAGCFIKFTYRNFARGMTGKDINNTNNTGSTKFSKNDNKNSKYDLSDLSDIENGNENLTNNTIDITGSEHIDNKPFNFENFEKRNQELNTNNKKNNFKPSESVLESLSDLINQEESVKNLSKKQQKIVEKTINNKSSAKNISPPELEEQIVESSYLVKRPGKNFQWGLGQQTNRKKCKY